MKTFLKITFITFTILFVIQACAPKHVQEAGQRAINTANQIDTANAALTNALTKYPPELLEDNALLEAFVMMLPEDYEEKVNNILETTGSARAAITKINTELAVKWSNNARSEGEALLEKYETIKADNKRTLNNFLAIAGSVVSVLTGGGLLKTARTAATAKNSLRQVVEGVENARSNLNDDQWNDILKPALDRANDEKTRKQVAAIKKSLQT